MILCDTGPLVAIIEERDVRHVDCTATLANLESPLISTWACLTEAMHLVGRKRGHPGQMALWSMMTRGILTVYSQDEFHWRRMRELMVQYRDVSMDFADASLVVLAEVLDLPRIFTVDGDFRIYRLADGRAFEIVPE
jgi:predicted nucleic acid-binding protein